MLDPHYHNERAPILRIFGDHCARMAILLRLNPLLLQRVVYAPRPAIHAMGAFLHLSPEALQSDATVAAMLEASNPRDLLRSAIPNALRKLYRALDRAGDHVLDKSCYQRLATLCASPLANFLVSGGSLNPRRLGRLEALLEMDPIIRSLPVVWDREWYEIESINSVITFLRAHGAFDEADFKLPHEAGLPAVLRKFQKAFDRIEAPAPTFSLSPPLRIVRTVGELRGVGKLLNNCVRNFRSFGTDHWFRLASREAIYIATDVPPMLAALRKVGPNLWFLDEVEGPENTDILSDRKAMLTNALRTAGVRLVRESPAHALRALGARHCLAECEDDLDEFVESPDVGASA
jgi:hypothetical protein